MQEGGQERRVGDLNRDRYEDVLVAEGGFLDAVRQVSVFISLILLRCLVMYTFPW